MGINTLGIKKEFMEPLKYTAKLKYIELGLENVESLIFDINDFKHVKLKGIMENLTLHANYKHKYQLEKSKTIQNIYLEIKSSANIPYEGMHKNLTGKLDRLKLCPDIVDITLYYENGAQETFWVDWEDKTFEGYSNLYQQNFTTAQNNLIIIISRDEKCISSWLKFKEIIK